MTACLACSAGDPTHHLPPGACSLTDNGICASPSGAVGCGLAAAQQNASLIKYLYVGDLARTGRIKALSAGFSIIKAFETFRLVGALLWCGGVYVAGERFSHTYLHGDYAILPFLNSFLFPERPTRPR